MKILLAKDAGYCFGVRDAVNLAYDTADKDGDVYMLGHIVHNENVVKDLIESKTKKIIDEDDIRLYKSYKQMDDGTIKTRVTDDERKISKKDDKSE